MRGREFLRVARQTLSGGDQASWRATTIHAYYSLFLECRDTLTAWGRAAPPKQNVHNGVRLTFLFSSDSQLKKISDYLDYYQRLRNLASYDLRSRPEFMSDAVAIQAIRDIDAGLVLLDAVEADPARRAAALASLPP